jgi:hypothetical protein
MPGETMTKRFQIAISFARPQRGFADELKQHMERRGIKTFYDYDHRPDLLGEFLPAKLNEIFGDQSDYVAVLISKDYVERVWPRHESKAIIDRMMQTDRAFVLPIRFDDTMLPGLVNSIGHADAREQSAAEIATIICDKVGAPKLAKLSDAPPPQHTNMMDTVEFDYSRYNGRYVLGDRQFSFETAWSGSGNDSIVAYNDGKNIVGVAIAKGVEEVSNIDNAEAYDYSSRACRPKRGQYVVFQNETGFFCAVKIIEIRSAGHGHQEDYLKISYVISPDGSGNFNATAIG